MTRFRLKNNKEDLSNSSVIFQWPSWNFESSESSSFEFTFTREPVCTGMLGEVNQLVQWELGIEEGPTVVGGGSGAWPCRIVHMRLLPLSPALTTLCPPPPSPLPCHPSRHLARERGWPDRPSRKRGHLPGVYNFPPTPPFLSLYFSLCTVLVMMVKEG